MNSAIILSLTPTMAASFVLKGFVDRCCTTEAFNITNFESYGCIWLPAKASSIIFTQSSNPTIRAICSGVNLDFISP